MISLFIERQLSAARALICSRIPSGKRTMYLLASGDAVFAVLLKAFSLCRLLNAGQDVFAPLDLLNHRAVSMPLAGIHDPAKALRSWKRNPIFAFFLLQTYLSQQQVELAPADAQALTKLSRGEEYCRLVFCIKVLPSKQLENIGSRQLGYSLIGADCRGVLVQAHCTGRPNDKRGQFEGFNSLSRDNGLLTLRTHRIAAGFTDCREDFFKHQPFKGFRCRKGAVDDEAQDIGFRENAKLLHAASGLKGVLFLHPLAMIANCCSWIFVAKRFADVFGYKQRLSAFVGYDTDWLGFKLEWDDARASHDLLSVSYGTPPYFSYYGSVPCWSSKI